jgi:hypothetical protein
LSIFVVKERKKVIPLGAIERDEGGNESTKQEKQIQKFNHP